MIANRPDWTFRRQRQWGVPDGLPLAQRDRRLHPRTFELLK